MRSPDAAAMLKAATAADRFTPDDAWMLPAPDRPSVPAAIVVWPE